MKKLPATTRRRLALAAASLAIATGASFGALMAFLDNYGQTDRARAADAIVVLGSRVQPGGVPSNSLRRRALQAAALYRRGIASHIICTGGVGDNPPAESSVAAVILKTQGVPEHAIVAEELSTSTWENAEQAAAICRQHGWKRVVVVSEPYHLWRATRNFREFGLEATSSPAGNPEAPKRLQMTSRECLSVLRDLLARR